MHSAALEILSAKDAGAAGVISLKYADSKYKKQILSEVQRLCFAAARAKTVGNASAESAKLAANWQLAALIAGAEIYGGAMRDIKFNAYYSALLFSAMLKMIEENNKWLKLSE